MPKSLADRIKEVREASNLKQAEFAKQLGINQAHVSRLEAGAGTPSDPLIKLICSSFDVNEDWLRRGIGPMMKPQTDPDGRIRGIAYDNIIYIVKMLAQFHSAFLSSLEEQIQKAKKTGIQIDPGHPRYAEFDAARQEIVSNLDQIKSLLNSIDSTKNT